MALKLYNTRTKAKEEFKPIDPSNVRMYVCGPTVYDNAHIGNARPVIVFDVLFRLLKHLAAKGEWDNGRGETKVTYVRNITDVDDKINARAAEKYPDLPPLDAIAKLTKETTAQFHADVAALGCLPPTHEPRATDYVRNPAAASDMIRIIQRLIDRDHAYPAEGHVLFAVASDPNYGKLARRSLDEMQAGARVEVAPYKRDAMDFVLWKPSAPTEPGWESPWGYGRPGWHLECSAMSAALLGETFDIHGGGIDLVFPHHENELAQSTCAHGTDIMANTWMHNGFLQVEGQKMSKSLGNFYTIDDLINTTSFKGQWRSIDLRLAMLMTQYRQPIDFSTEKLLEARSLLRNYGHAIRGFDPIEPQENKVILDALSDDLNTHEARVELDRLCKAARSTEQNGEVAVNAKREIVWGLEMLGFQSFVEALTKPDLKRSKSVELALEGVNVTEFIEARNAARAARNFAEADRIRDELAAMGIALKDAKDPVTGEIVTTWEIAR